MLIQFSIFRHFKYFQYRKKLNLREHLPKPLSFVKMLINQIMVKSSSFPLNRLNLIREIRLVYFHKPRQLVLQNFFLIGRNIKVRVLPDSLIPQWFILFLIFFRPFFHFMIFFSVFSFYYFFPFSFSQWFSVGSHIDSIYKTIMPTKQKGIRFMSLTYKC